MERRVLLAVLLSFLVLYAYQALFPPPPDQSKPGTTSTNPAGSSTALKSPPAGTAQPTAVTAEAPVQTPSLSTTVSARDVVVESPSVRAVFTSAGGTLKSWHLKKYHDTAGQPLELVPQHVPPDTPRPFTLAVDDAAVSTGLAAASFNTSTDNLTVDRAPQTLRFDYHDDTGVDAHKTFTFRPDQPYVVVVSATVTRNGQPLPTTIDGGPALGSGLVPHSRGYNPAPQGVFFKDTKVTRLPANKIDAQPVHEGTFGFAGVEDHYFLVALVAPKESLRVQYRPLSVPVEGTPDGAHFVSWSARFPAAANDVRYFLGPKDIDALLAVDPTLSKAIDFGWFDFLVVPLLRALKWVNSYVGNYGWALIILTILINVAMFPLRHKSVVSMRKMQEIQPEVKAIQDRYAKLKMSDPARSKMNVELMNLYRERGVNPASGCVPMLMTMPVLFAFYSLLSVAIELRGAPFIGWIHDLSAPDPLFITPILMGITMFIQQKMTPSTADPMQQRMMLVMPAVMTTMFLWAASGLVLYWTVSNVWGIGQQMITNRLIGPSPQRTVRPPAERVIKRAGSGKSDQAKERP
jgi:YidC/Oxa1 family membrane protein insertase